MNSAARYARRGLSLIEIMVVILIMGLVAAIGYPLVSGRIQKANITTTKSNLKLLQTSIVNYQMDLGSLPKKLEDLVEKPKGDAAKKWLGYIQGDKLPKDAWGNEFQYKPTPSGKKQYELYSYGSSGPDGSGDEDTTISVWDI